MKNKSFNMKALVYKVVEKGPNKGNVVITLEYNHKT
jgi:hypothetical protein